MVAGLVRKEALLALRGWITNDVRGEDTMKAKREVP